MQSAKKYHTSEQKQSGFSLKVAPSPSRPNKQHITDEINKENFKINSNQARIPWTRDPGYKGKYASSCHTFDI